MTEAFIQNGPKQRASETVNKKYRIVGDSSMSLDKETAMKWGIARIDNYVTAQGKSIPDSEIDLNGLFAMMREGYVFSTAQTSAEAVKAFFDRQLQSSENLIFLAVGHAYTGTQETVRRARNGHNAKDKIFILDTRAASGQQGLIALAVAQFSEQAADIGLLLKYAEKQIAECREYLVIDNLEYLRRSGRIGKIKAKMASALTIKPIVGHGKSGAVTYAKVRSHEAAIAEITKRAVNHPGHGPLMVMVEFTDNRARAVSVAESLGETLPKGTEILLTPLSSSSAVHMGPGTWGVSVTRK